MTGGARTLHGLPASPGSGIGVVLRFQRQPPVEDAQRIADDAVDSEIARFHAALDRARASIATAKATLAERAGEREAAIFDAHALVLADPALVDETERRIRDECLPASPALAATIDAIRAMFAEIEDDYLRERASDIEDVGNQLLRALQDRDTALGELPEASVIVADELFPSDTATLDLSRVVGLVTERGSATAHVAILARALGVPTVVGVAGALEATDDGVTAIVDGDAGTVTLNPDAPALDAARRLQEQQRGALARRAALRDVEAVTPAGTQITLLANIGGPAEAEAALAHGAEGVGLFRTEFLFLDQPALPTEDEQYAAYRQVAEAFGEQPVVIRTLDAGGDKPIPGVSDRMEPEDNPFLGVRGLRLSLAFPDQFRTQLRALLRAAAHGNLWIMFPMVATLEDVLDARRAVAAAVQSLASDGVTHQADPPLGIMIEVPSAAIAIDLLIDAVDFVSIGTNDLIQYTLAADRTNPAVAARYGSLDPAVQRLIASVAETARARGKPAGVCGELAGDPSAIPTLISLGIHELSMTPTRIPAAKEVIRAGRDA